MKPHSSFSGFSFSPHFLLFFQCNGDLPTPYPKTSSSSLNHSVISINTSGEGVRQNCDWSNSANIPVPWLVWEWTRTGMWMCTVNQPQEENKCETWVDTVIISVISENNHGERNGKYFKIQARKSLASSKHKLVCMLMLHGTSHIFSIVECEFNSKATSDHKHLSELWFLFLHYLVMIMNITMVRPVKF